MALPTSITPITVTGQYLHPDGAPARGAVEFRLSAPATVPADKAIVAQAATKVDLDDAGRFTTVLPASDDPDWGVSGLTYQVTERIIGAADRTYSVTILAAAAGGTADLAALAPAVAGPVLVTYALDANAVHKTGDETIAGSKTFTGMILFGDGSVGWYQSSPGTVRTDGALSVAGGFGVNGSNPVAKPLVTGSRSDGTALASLLSALALQGLITDSTTA